MKAVILVPFRPDGAERERNWGIARRFWAHMGLPIVEGDFTGREFQRAHSRNSAARKAGEWDVALFVDADIVLDGLDQAEEALAETYMTGAYTVAYSRLNYLTEAGTLELDQGIPPWSCAFDETVGLTWECCFAISREIFEQVGGFDERFHGWGGQVAAFFYAYATFGGRARVEGNAYHLAHPLVDREQDPHWDTNRELCDRYLDAVDKPKTMAKILEER